MTRTVLNKLTNKTDSDVDVDNDDDVNDDTMPLIDDNGGWGDEDNKDGDGDADDDNDDDDDDDEDNDGNITFYIIPPYKLIPLFSWPKCIDLVIKVAFKPRKI